jgi:CHAD domain-containing protein
MKMQTLLLVSLNTRWDKYQAELKTCQREFSEEAVHDFRVATRRLLSSLDLIRAVMPDPRIQKTRSALKDQLDSLDDLRDAQVLLADISEIIHQLPVIKPFQEYLQHREKKLIRAAQKEVKSLKTETLSKRIKKINQTIEAFKQTDLDSSIFLAVDEAYAVVRKRYELVDPMQPATIHRLRISFKKFRYMIEVIYPFLQSSPADYLKRMHNYQTTMGDIQDMEVAMQELADFGELAPASSDPEPVHSYYKERHTLAISRYIEGKDEVFTFWRSAPDQSFPKEK